MLQQIVRIDTEALRRILEVSVDTGQATAGGAASLTDTTKEWVVNQFVNYAVEITEGTGKGQFRQITANTATVLTVAAWTIVPDATSWYRITPFGIIAGIVFADIQKWGTVPVTGYNITPLFKSIPEDEGTVTVLAVGATLTDTNKNWTANIFKGYNVRIVEGTGAGQTRKIISNTGTVLTVDSAWGVSPTTDSKYSIKLAPVCDPVGDMGVFIASGDQPVGRVTVQSHAHLGSGDMPIGRVTIQSSPYIASGDMPIGRVTVQSHAALGSGDDPIGQARIYGFSTAGGSAKIMNVEDYGDEANIAAGKVIGVAAKLMSSDNPVGRVTVRSMVNIASGDEPVGRVTIQSQAFLASGNQPIGQVTVASFGGGLSSSDVSLGRVTVQSFMGGLASGDQPIGQVTVRSMANLASGDESIGKVTVQSMCSLASGDRPIGQVTIASMPTATVSPTWDSRTMNFASVQISSSGMNEIVSAVASARIIVRSVAIIASGPVVARWYTASSPISGELPITGNSGYTLHDPEGVLQTGIGERLGLDINGNVPVGGHLGYITRLS